MTFQRSALLLALLIVAAGCSNAADEDTTADAAPTTSVTPSATSAAPPTTVAQSEAELEADLALIGDLWSEESIAFSAGFEEGLSYWVENNYPVMECTYEDYLSTRFPEGPVDGLHIERVADELTITRDNGWVVPGGSLVGHAPDGRIYAMSVETTTTAPDTLAEPATVRNLHVVVLDGRAHFFLGCPA